jgi:hypothetical protein
MSDTSTLQVQLAWQPQPKAWSLLLDLVDRACRASTFIRTLTERMHEQTGTRLVDWLDHVCVPESELSDQSLREVGFDNADDRHIWCHTAGLFPRIVRPNHGSGFPTSGLAIKVDDVDCFLRAQHLAADVQVQGKQFANLRFAVAWPHATHSLVVVERHGNRDWTIDDPTSQQITAIRDGSAQLATRPRPLRDPPDGFAAARSACDALAAQLGQAWACDLFFFGERNYWQSRNRAGQVQFARQNSLGLGWANHDHHTYRSSREHFASLISLLEHMGFQCRERFYAGAQAGWGAQVLEHAVCPFVIFADVDLSPGEVAGDFPHEGLAPRKQLGTVGLWCKLHGEAMLSAGLHHLECQFDFDAARRQLAQAGIETMEPFTDFPYLRQAFTVGEQWPIESSHLECLVRDGWITPEQATQFARQGARGSHLEILERNDGFKGFNQTGISEIITRTDPRVQS